MSDMVKARELMQQASAKWDHGMQLLEEANELYAEARQYMVRQSPVRRAEAQEVEITDDLREQVQKLAKRSNLTMTAIARRVGLRNVGRVSEILTGKR